MKRLLIGGFAATVAVLLGLAGSTPRVEAAPVPKDAGKGEATPDLKAVFDSVGKAVKDEKWPAAADEKKLTDTARTVFNRMLKAADQKERGLPVDFQKLTKADVTKDYKQGSVSGTFVIAENVRGTTAKDSVIFASGDVQFTGATNCVIVAQNVRCTSAENCFVVAGEQIRLTSAHRRDGSDGSVLLAGQWIRTTGMGGAICHVLRPGQLPAPDEAKFAGNLPNPAIRTNGAAGVIFLNDRGDTGANGPKNCTYLPQKNPIAK